MISIEIQAIKHDILNNSVHPKINLPPSLPNISSSSWEMSSYQWPKARELRLVLVSSVFLWHLSLPHSKQPPSLVMFNSLNHLIDAYFFLSLYFYLNLSHVYVTCISVKTSNWCPQFQSSSIHFSQSNVFLRYISPFLKKPLHA